MYCQPIRCAGLVAEAVSAQAWHSPVLQSLRDAVRVEGSDSLQLHLGSRHAETAWQSSHAVMDEVVVCLTGSVLATVYEDAHRSVNLLSQPGTHHNTVALLAEDAMTCAQGAGCALEVVSGHAIRVPPLCAMRMHCMQSGTMVLEGSALPMGRYPCPYQAFAKTCMQLQYSGGALPFQC